MAHLQSVSNNSFDKQINGALLEKIIIGNDLSGLNPIEKVQYVKGICSTLGLNPLTKPIQLMKFQGKEIPYFTKDASEQLRSINKVSITKIETQMHDGGLYVVTAYASLADGRQDSSTGAIVVSGLKGDSLANAMMKAETKAKRRVTLSICGLGFIDECEVDSIPGAQKIDITQQPEIKKVDFAITDEDDNALLLNEFLSSIETSQSLESLQSVFIKIKSSKMKQLPEFMEKLIAAKDKRKEELMMDEFNFDPETGELK